MEEKLLVPEWLNGEFLQKALRNEVKGSNLAVSKFDLEPAVPKGENYGSYLVRVIAQFSYTDENNQNKTGTRRMIIKTLPPLEHMKAFFTITGVFQRESKVYLEILPAMYRLLEQVQGSGMRYLTGKCIYYEQDILVIEDLSSSGYKMADRKSGLDLPHCKIALRSLALFHATSVALNQKDPTVLANCDEFYREERRPFLEGILIPVSKCLATVVGKWPGYERFEEKINRFTETAVDKALEVVKPKEGSLSVLNHGDCWVNNMLFRYSDSGEVVDIKFIDFQISRFSSPALDLQYFMHLSPSEELQFEREDYLLEFYHTELRRFLKELGCEHIQFTLQQLKKEYEDSGIFGLIATFCVLQLVLAEEAHDMMEITEDLFNSAELFQMAKGFSGTLFRNRFQKLLVKFEKKGVL